MNDQADVEAILGKFRDWLEDARLEAEDQEGIEPGLDSQPGPPPREFGIIDLVEEFTALRHELKLQTKSGRGLLEQTENTVAALRQAIDQFRSVEPKEIQAAWTAAKGLAEALADLDEALVRGEREIDRAQHQIADESVRKLEKSAINLFRERSWIRRRFLRSYHQEIIETIRRDGLARRELFESFLEGYRLIQKRLRRALLSRVIRFAEVQAVRGAWRSPSAPEDEDADEMEPDEGEVEPGPAELSGHAEDSRSGPARPGPTEE
jgi:molecular chaperone GrpE